jgi:hypothetical protein
VLEVRWLAVVALVWHRADSQATASGDAASDTMAIAMAG